MTPFVSGLLAWIWLGDKLGVFQIFMMLLCFAGVVLVACSKNKGNDDDDSEKSSGYEIGIVLTSLLAVIFAVSAVSTRRLKTMHFSVLQFYLASVSTLSSLIWLIVMATQQEIFAFEGAVPWVEIVVGSLCDYFSQMLMIFMMQSMNPAVVGMFSYVKVFYAFLSDIFIFHMTLSTLQLVGCIAVFVFSLAAAYENKRADDR